MSIRTLFTITSPYKFNRRKSKRFSDIKSCNSAELFIDERTLRSVFSAYSSSNFLPFIDYM